MAIATKKKIFANPAVAAETRAADPGAARERHSIHPVEFEHVLGRVYPDPPILYSDDSMFDLQRPNLGTSDATGAVHTDEIKRHDSTVPDTNGERARVVAAAPTRRYSSGVAHTHVSGLAI